LARAAKESSRHGADGSLITGGQRLGHLQHRVVLFDDKTAAPGNRSRQLLLLSIELLERNLAQGPEAQPPDAFLALRAALAVFGTGQLALGLRVTNDHSDAIRRQVVHRDAGSGLHSSRGPGRQDTLS
jgi:hypothetical protein